MKLHSRRLCPSGPKCCDTRIMIRVGVCTCGGPGTIRAVFSGVSTEYHRVSRGSSCPWQSHTNRGVRRPGAISVAGSRGTPQITGVACGAETRHSERRADPGGVSRNAGTAGRSSRVQHKPEHAK